MVDFEKKSVQNHSQCQAFQGYRRLVSQHFLLLAYEFHLQFIFHILKTAVRSHKHPSATCNHNPIIGSINRYQAVQDYTHGSFAHSSVASRLFDRHYSSFKMYLMYTLDEDGKRVYTLKKVKDGQVTKSAHPAKFSPDDQYSRYVYYIVLFVK